jgi:GTP cyclohydrolase I
MKYNKFLEELEKIDADHKKFSIETPLRKDAFEISDDEKISIIQQNVKEILETLGMDMTDDSLKGTPLRVAKAYVKELFGGLNPKNLPKASTFDNKYQYGEMLVEKNITVFFYM